MTEITNNTALDTASYDEASNTNRESEKMFTQDQLEKYISERLMRERKTNESLSDIRRMLKEVSEKGIIKSKSYAEMADEIAEKLSMISEKEDVSDEVQPVNGQEKETLAVAAAKGSQDAVSDGNVNGGEEENAQARDEDNSFMGVLCEIKARYPRKALENLLYGNLFEDFAKGRSGNMAEIFGDFCSFMSKAKGNVSEEFSEADSDFVSTGFSSQSGTAYAGANLTKQQMEIAKSAGMSYREYAALLESVPKKAGRKI